MSEESKQVFQTIKNEAWIIEKAIKIAKEYAGSANSNPTYIPGLIDDIVHLLKTGENPRN